MGKKSLLEAVLFLSGKAMTERQLSEATGISTTGIKRLLTILNGEYEERGSALRVARRGRRWVMQVREEYMEKAAHMAPTTLPPAVLKSASLIAYYQPVKQSHLVRILGTKAYDHIRRLREGGLIAARPSGRTLLLSTTSKFLEFFGLEARSREDLRRLMAERIGARGEGDSTSSG
ncbi:MAG: SMC-Scp complex subunit ScpB [Candidatus Thermoplasmatota archaeon]|nr:SMC-Scp complex subunit ScpB [Candidatus Thermoplasmatota archaeon]